MKKTIFGLALGLSFVTGTAQAEMVSFDFSGHWTTVSSELNSWFTVSKGFSGNISYDSETKSSDKNSFEYAGQSMAFSTAMANGTLWTGTVTKPMITIYNNDSSHYYDQFRLDLPGFIDSSVIFSASSTSLPHFLAGKVELVDYGNTVFSNTSLPSECAMTSLPMQFESGIFDLTFFKNNNGNAQYLYASGTIDSITHPTPEPATFLLFGTALPCLAAYRRRRSH